jgi:hypothetical protein
MCIGNSTEVITTKFPLIFPYLMVVLILKYINSIQTSYTYRSVPTQVPLSTMLLCPLKRPH